MRIAWCLVVAGCWSTVPPAEPTDDTSVLVMTQTGVGPIHASTIVTLSGLRAMLPQYRVVPDNDPQLQYDLLLGTERLGYVVINDDQTVYNIHMTSGRVRVDGRTWRAGQPFQDAKQLTSCECWGSHPTCYAAGDHVAVNFDRSCLDSDDARARKVLDGLVIDRVIWSATAFGPPADPIPSSGDDAADDEPDPP